MLSGANTINIGNLTPSRDLTYVKDTTSGFLAVYHSDKLFGETINIGMNDEVSMEELALKLITLCDRSAVLKQTEERVRPDNSEVERLRCDNSILINNTNWKLAYNLDSGLKETIEWISNHLDRYKPDIYNV